MAEITWQEKAWDRISRVFFHPGTGLVYDYITADDPEERFPISPPWRKFRFRSRIRADGAPGWRTAR